MKTIFTNLINYKSRIHLPACLLLMALCLSPLKANAQLSSNADKFLGNITTSYSVDYGNEPFHTLWNQITPENESKWQSIEGSRRGSFSWGGCDNAFNYAKNHNFPFKFHCLIWGAQYPNWLNSLSTEEQYKAIEEWMDAIKAHYPELPLIDVVNEAVAGHQPAPYKAALGGDGKTGFDWIIKAFEMAHERWPDAILIYNDYNTFQWQRTEFIQLVKTLRDAGAPIDAYGCQSHDLTDMNFTNFKAAMTEIQDALQMPMYSTEYDIGTTDDQLQLQRYQEQIPYMWEADYCAGITLWGYIYGHTWTTDGNSGLIRDGKDRPAMTWLRNYMASDAAKTAKSPFPGMVKEASVYVMPSKVVR
jgi:GH35 family endo-1,4-beta-xylanase